MTVPTSLSYWPSWRTSSHAVESPVYLMTTVYSVGVALVAEEPEAVSAAAEPEPAVVLPKSVRGTVPWAEPAEPEPAEGWAFAPVQPRTTSTTTRMSSTPIAPRHPMAKRGSARRAEKSSPPCAAREPPERGRLPPRGGTEPRPCGRPPRGAPLRGTPWRTGTRPSVPARRARGERSVPSPAAPRDIGRRPSRGAVPMRGSREPLGLCGGRRRRSKRPVAAGSRTDGSPYIGVASDTYPACGGRWPKREPWVGASR